MPVTKFRCEYCNRLFNGDPVTRRTHFDSKYHNENVERHYASLKRPSDLLVEDKTRQPCVSFFVNGSCRNISFCPFSHVRSPENTALVQDILYHSCPFTPSSTPLPPSLIPPSRDHPHTDPEPASWGW
eukprot:TRINITY_DN4185_c0_g1_i1.p2 TRINITY_DN4185_c0_g1~~TRINITY_DN4185_c0_g1_i1.p2  ORF type:complete len:128 (-),score=34.23 TRINITY_DN4185_c0_g1_i1:16-399(-)